MRICKDIPEQIAYTRRLFERIKVWGETYGWSQKKKRDIGIILLDRVCVIESMVRGIR